MDTASSSPEQVGDLRELETLGLDQVALDVYRALLESPEVEEQALATDLQLDSDTLRGTMQRLRDLQLLMPTWAMPGLEHAVQPSAGIQALLQRRRAELTQQQDALQRTEVAATAIAEQLNERLITRSGGDVEILRGRLRANSRIAEIAEATERTLWVLNPTDFSDPMPPFDQDPSLPLLERGIRIRAIYLASVTSKKVAIELFDWHRGWGVETRAVPTMPMRVMVYDQKLVIVPLDPDDPLDAAVVHRSPAVVRLAVELFQCYWAKATDVFEGKETEPEALTPQEAELIRLLTDGATDEHVARQFGVSLRTVRRMASELSKRTGARSRFELGVRATQRGWIT